MSVENLNDYSIEDLEEALKQKRKENVPKARPLEDIMEDIPDLLEVFKQEHQIMVSTRQAPKDNEHYKFEVLMILLYGKDYWNWYNDIVK